MRIIRKIIVTLLIASLLLLTACAKPQTIFDIGYTAYWSDPVYIEKVQLDNNWSMSGGLLSRDWQEIGKLIVLAPPYPPVPKKIFIRWFNYTKQVFFEATVKLPNNAHEVMVGLPVPQYGANILTIGVLPNGQVVVWACTSYRARTGIWIELAREQGIEAEGDPAEYQNTTAGMLKRGRI